MIYSPIPSPTPNKSSPYPFLFLYILPLPACHFLHLSPKEITGNLLLAIALKSPLEIIGKRILAIGALALLSQVIDFKRSM